MITHMMNQYSSEWWEARRGIPTCSEFDRVLTSGGRDPSKAKLSGSAQKYACRLAAEVRSLEPNFFTDRPITRAMAAGTETEPEARNWYAMEHDTLTVQQVGFVTTDDKRFGGSPDAICNPVFEGAKIVGCEGGLELKCVQPDTHVGYIMDPAELIADYRGQVHGSLLVTKAKWWDLVSYAKGFDPVIVRVTPDAYTVALAAALQEFRKMYDAVLTRVGGAPS